MVEKWKTCKGFSKYLISTNGIFINKKTNCKFKGMINEDGYIQVTLCTDTGKPYHKSRLAHVLVALTFIGPKPKRKEVNHKDLNRSNPKLSNLEYITHLENILYSVNKGVKFGGEVTPLKGRKNGNNKLSPIDIIKIRKIKNKTQYQIAKEFNVSQTLISFIRRKKHWKYI